MAKRRRLRQCQRCGRMNAPTTARKPQCAYCGATLYRPRFTMTRQRLAAIHTMARKKGLIDEHGDDELYRIRLREAYGISSSKDIRNAEQFYQIMRDMKRMQPIQR